MTYTTPTLGNEMRDIKRRLAKLERGLSRNLIFTGGGVHIPGELTVGSGSDGYGSGVPIVSGAPDAPTGLTATPGADATDSYVDIGWDWTYGPPTVVQFEVRWRRDGDSEYNYTVVNTNSIRLSKLVAGTDYDVNVRAISSLGITGPWFNGGTDITATAGSDVTAPGQVTGLTVAVGFSTMMATWNERDEADLDRYRLQVSTNSGFTAVVYDQYIYANVITVDELDAETTYYWRVRAVDRSGNEGTWSATSSGDTQLIADAYISDLTATKITAGTVGVHVIKLSNSSGSRIESSDPLVSLIIRGDGYAKFTNIAITGLNNTDGLAIGSGSNIFKVDYLGNHWAGNASFASAPFRVSTAGALVASSAQITGSSLFGNPSAANLYISGSYIFFREGSTTRGKIDFSGSTYGNGITITNYTGSGVGTNYATMITGTLKAILTGGTGGSTYIGSLDASSGVSTATYIDAVNTLRYDVSSGSHDFRVANVTVAVIESSSGAGRIQLAGATTGDEGGELLLLTASGGDNNLYIDNWKNGTDSYMRVHNGATPWFRVRLDNGAVDLINGATFWATSIYNNAVTGRDVYVASTGQVGYLSSTARNKQNISSLIDLYGIEKLKSDALTINAIEYEYDPDKVGGADGIRHVGLMAEAVAEKFQHLAFYNPENGEPDGVDYKGWVALLLTLWQDAEHRLQSLESVVAA